MRRPKERRKLPGPQPAKKQLLRTSPPAMRLGPSRRLAMMHGPDSLRPTAGDFQFAQTTSPSATAPAQLLQARATRQGSCIRQFVRKYAPLAETGPILRKEMLAGTHVRPRKRRFSNRQVKNGAAHTASPIGGRKATIQASLRNSFLPTESVAGNASSKSERCWKMRRRHWRYIDDIERRAAAKAINKTVRMLQDAFNVEAEGSSPTMRRKSVIEKIDQKMRKARKKRKGK